MSTHPLPADLFGSSWRVSRVAGNTLAEAALRFNGVLDKSHALQAAWAATTKDVPARGARARSLLNAAGMGWRPRRPAFNVGGWDYEDYVCD